MPYDRIKQIWDKKVGRGIKQNRHYSKGESFCWKNLKFWNTWEYKELNEYLLSRLRLGYSILPNHPTESVLHKTKIFRSLIDTPYKDTKIVIIGQDPYYTKGMADGLAFSVPPNIKKIPGSLLNIFKEYQRDLGFPYPRTGDLSTWSRNGVLLFNSVWTVEEGSPKIHYKINGKKLWQELTAEIITSLNRKDKVVFILWGNSAKEWRYLIDEKKHSVLEGAHPSPRNFTWTGKEGTPKFEGGSYFTKACEILRLDTKIWRLP